MREMRSAWKSICRRGMRNLLTVISIAIGVAALVLTGTVAQAGKQAVEDEIACLGIGGLSVTADRRLMMTELGAEELRLIGEMEHITGAIPVMVQYGRLAMHGLISETVVWGIGSGADQVISLEAIHGRLLENQDVVLSRDVCLVDQAAAQLFYGRDNIVGKKLSLLLEEGERELTVVGIVSSGGNALQSMIGEYLPAFVYLPYTTLQQVSGREGFDQIAVKVTEGEDAEKIGGKIVDMLEYSSGLEGAYLARNMAGQKERLTRLMDIVGMALSGVAAISLVVSGLGTTTVMLVSVRERTREIGIKRAIGARTGRILSEFMLEAVLLSAAGGVLGAGLGTAGTLLARLLFGIKMLPSPGLVAVGIGFSLLSGILFGVYPAWRASRLDPVEALRQE